MPVTALYAGLLAFVFIYLAVRVIAARKSQKIAVGDGGDQVLLRRMRVHANFAEYTPLALILIALLESLHADHRILHALGLLLLAGRCLHAWGVSQPKEDLRFRQAGMIATFAVVAIGGLLCVFGALWNGTVF